MDNAVLDNPYKNKGIIVVTYTGSPWMSDCLSSLTGVKYPIYICINPKGRSAYDAEGFYYAKKHGIKDFIILHDSMEIKDISLFDKLFELEGNVQLSRAWQMFLGKFSLDKLPPLPHRPVGKMAAVNFESSYLRGTKADHIPFELLKDTKVFIFKQGKKRMVIENEYLIKFKGTWETTSIGANE